MIDLLAFYASSSRPKSKVACGFKNPTQQSENPIRNIKILNPKQRIRAWNSWSDASPDSLDVSGTSSSADPSELEQLLGSNRRKAAFGGVLLRDRHRHRPIPQCDTETTNDVKSLYVKSECGLLSQILCLLFFLARELKVSWQAYMSYHWHICHQEIWLDFRVINDILFPLTEQHSNNKLVAAKGNGNECLEETLTKT
jgi:hypothetical protein